MGHGGKDLCGEWRVWQSFPLFLFVLATTLNRASASTNLTDTNALLAVKAAFGNPPALVGWVGDNPCAGHWAGIICDATDPQNIISLSLRSMGLAGPLPAAIAELASLQTLEVSTNEVSGPIPAAISHLRHLVQLNLKENNLSGPIPPQIGNLTHLRILDLRSNQLTGNVPPALARLQQLTKLRLENNQLAGVLPLALEKIPNLGFDTALVCRASNPECSAFLHAPQPSPYTCGPQNSTLGGSPCSEPPAPAPALAPSTPRVPPPALLPPPVVATAPPPPNSSYLCAPAGEAPWQCMCEGGYVGSQMCASGPPPGSSSLHTCTCNTTCLPCAAGRMHLPTLAAVAAGGVALGAANSKQATGGIKAEDGAGVSSAADSCACVAPLMLRISLLDLRYDDFTPASEETFLGNLALLLGVSRSQLLAYDRQPGSVVIDVAAMPQPPASDFSSAEIASIRAKLAAANGTGGSGLQDPSFGRLALVSVVEPPPAPSPPPPAAAAAPAGGETDTLAPAASGEPSPPPPPAVVRASSNNSVLVPAFVLSLLAIIIILSVVGTWAYRQRTRIKFFDPSSHPNSSGSDSQFPDHHHDNGDENSRSHEPGGGSTSGSAGAGANQKCSFLGLKMKVAKMPAGAATVVAGCCSGHSGPFSISVDRPASAMRGVSPMLSSKMSAMGGTHFLFDELHRQTRGFSQQHLVGTGGSSNVYRATLSDGQTVAIKRLERRAGPDVDKEFLLEVELLSRLHHFHLVALSGYCLERDQRILVYEYMPGGSLRDLLDDPKTNRALGFETRVTIALGAARGLEYLHESANPRVLHRDFKSSNILLDHRQRAKVADFGMAKAVHGEQSTGPASPAFTQVLGTFGYLAPEYASTGRASVKSDVFSFGVVLLELISGRRPLDHARPKGEESLVLWATPMLRDEARTREALVDPALRSHYPAPQMRRLCLLASACIQMNPDLRPTMPAVVQALSAILPDTRRLRKPGSSMTSGSFDLTGQDLGMQVSHSLSLSIANDYTRSRNQQRPHHYLHQNQQRRRSPSSIGEASVSKSQASMSEQSQSVDSNAISGAASRLSGRRISGAGAGAVSSAYAPPAGCGEADESSTFHTGSAGGGGNGGDGGGGGGGERASNSVRSSQESAQSGLRKSSSSSSPIILGGGGGGGGGSSHSGSSRAPRGLASPGQLV